MIPGYKLDLFAHCEANETICTNYVGSEDETGVAVVKGRSTTLGGNEFCRINVDATNYQAFMTLYDSRDDLGVLYPGWTRGKAIHVRAG